MLSPAQSFAIDESCGFILCSLPYVIILDIIVCTHSKLRAVLCLVEVLEPTGGNLPVVVEGHVAERTEVEEGLVVSSEEKADAGSGEWFEEVDKPTDNLSAALAVKDSGDPEVVDYEELAEPVGSMDAEVGSGADE